MLPSPAQVESARRALKAIAEGGHPSQSDALALRLWAGPHLKMLSLERIAEQILKEAGESPTHN